MNSDGAYLVDWWQHCALGGGLLLLVTWVLTRRLGQPARRQRLAEIGMLAALVLLCLSFTPTWLVVPLLPRTDTRPEKEQPVGESILSEPMTSVSDPTTDLVALDPPGEEPIDVRDALVEDSPTAQAEPNPLEPSSETRNGSSERPSPESRFWHSTFWWAAILYVIIVLLLAVRWALAHVGLWRLLREADDAPLWVAANGKELWQGRGVPPRLLISDRLAVPVSCGLWRPRVVLPRHILEGEPTTLRWILAHEFTHLARRDGWSCLLFGLGHLFFFYVPWFWWLRRQVRLCQEYVADAVAAELAPAAEDYAQFLLGLTTAGHIPVGATGVAGSRSDLSWRVTMLLERTQRLETYCPRRWSLIATAGLLTAAVLWSGLSLEASPAPEGVPIQEKPAAKDAPKTPAPKEEPATEKTPNVPSEFSKVPAQYREQMQRMMEMRQQGFGQGGGFGFGFAQQTGRLGVLVQPVSDVLVDQFELPKGQGLVITSVQPNSPAAKAGLKVHDILLEFNGKQVSNDVASLVRSVTEIKPDTAVDAVVLRKGKKETIKGITLPEVKVIRPPAPVFQGGGAPGGAFPNFQGNGAPGGAFPNVPGNRPFGGNFAAPGGIATFSGGPGSVLTTNFRTNNRFTTRHQEGSLIITVTGTVEDGKAKVSQIHVQDGRESNTYQSVDKVPEQYRDKVANLIELNEKSHTKIEIHTPPAEKKPAKPANEAK